MDEKEYNEIVEHYSALEQKRDALESEKKNTDDSEKKKTLDAELDSINEKLNLSVIEERQREARHALGRYTMEEASLIIQQSTGEWPSELQIKFKAAVLSGALPVYAPGKNTRYLYGNNFASCARVFYEEAYWNDLNEWLEKNEPRLEYKFPNPDAPAAKVKAVPVTKPSGDDWEVQARAIADRLALEKYQRGEREITARNTCDAVATELAKDSTMHGIRGERSAGGIRNNALKGWKFIPPTGTNGTSGTKK